MIPGNTEGFMENILWCVDNRLVHGKLVNVWLAYLKPKRVLIIDDRLAGDSFLSGIYRALVPIWMEVAVFSREDAGFYFRQERETDGREVVIVQSPVIFAQLREQGIPINEIILMDRVYLPNKIKIPEEHRLPLDKLLEKGTVIKVQLSPEEEPYLYQKEQ